MSLLTWIDLETTGLPNLSEHMVYEHEILEIAMVVTDDEYNEVDSLQLVISYDIDIMDICDDFVREMHTKNGLFEDCIRSDVSLLSAQNKCIDFLKGLGIQKGESPLCGSSTFLDRAFLDAQMPLFNEFLHYRTLDITSVSIFLDSVGYDAQLKKSSSHRAMDDILASINNARRYKNMLPSTKLTEKRRHYSTYDPSLLID